MKKYLPSIVSLAVMAAGLAAQPAQDYISHHPAVFLIVSAAMQILNHFLPAPK